MIIPLKGYAPDVPSFTPGVLITCAALVPSLKGMEGAPSAQTGDYAALSAACQGAASLRKLDNTGRVFAATGTDIFEAAGGTWTERTRASADYAAGSDQRFRFAQFGDVSLAIAKSDILQSSSASNFANATSTAPKGSIVETVGQFVFILDITDQATLDDGQDYPDGWWAAAKGSYVNWTPSVANECVKGRLTSTPGKIRAGKRFGSMLAAYKERALYLGRYVGPPSVWLFDLVPGEAGALSQEAVVDVGTADNPKHIFMGFDDFYEFDGSQPRPIGGDIKETVFNELNKAFSYAAMALHDRVNSRVYFYYPVAGSTLPDKCVVYNYKTGQWGRDDRTVEMVFEFNTSGITYDDLGTDYATYNDLPSIVYDSPFFTSGYPVPAIFNSSHVLQTLDGSTSTSTMTCWDFGSDEYTVSLSRVQPMFLTKPSAGEMTNYYRNSLGAALTTGQATSMDSRGRFDLLRSANWHRAAFTFTGPVELPALRIETQEDGV